WSELRERLAAVFATKTRDEWTVVFADSDACVSPVLDMEECLSHPHIEARGIFVRGDGVVQPGPAPRFSRTPGKTRHAPVDPAADTRAALRAWGIEDSRIDALAAA